MVFIQHLRHRDWKLHNPNSILHDLLSRTPWSLDWKSKEARRSLSICFIYTFRRMQSIVCSLNWRKQCFSDACLYVVFPTAYLMIRCLTCKVVSKSFQCSKFNFSLLSQIWVCHRILALMMRYHIAIQLSTWSTELSLTVSFYWPLQQQKGAEVLQKSTIRCWTFDVLPIPFRKSPN